MRARGIGVPDNKRMIGEFLLDQATLPPSNTSMFRRLRKPSLYS